MSSLVRRFTIGALCSVAIAQRAVAQQQTADTLRPSKVVGTVVDSTGVPLVGAEIGVLEHGELRVISNDSGKFELAGIPAGVVVFTARRLGYEAATFTATLKPGRTHRVTFSLTAVPQAVEGVTVSEAENPGHWLDIFERRKSAQRGTFITRQQIENAGTRMPSDILRSVPGIQILPSRFGGQQTVTMTRGMGARRCVPQIYVHTTPYSGSVDDFTADDIEAIEVYVGISEIPPELNRNSKQMCAAVVIWTRAPPAPRLRSAGAKVPVGDSVKRP